MKDIGDIHTWVFDLDNTLYDAETGLMDRVSARMSTFISDMLSVTLDEASQMRQRYWETHGTTLRGLMMEHQVDPHQFLAHAHDVDVTDIPRCEIISEYLEYLPGRKVIFTNAPRHFATRMTAHLGIDHHFDGMFSIEDTNFLPKPQRFAFDAFVQKFDVAPPHACMLDDMEMNLKTAAEIGMKTVWLHGPGQDADHPHVTAKAEKLADWLKHNIKK